MCFYSCCKKTQKIDPLGVLKKTKKKKKETWKEVLFWFHFLWIASINGPLKTYPPKKYFMFKIWFMINVPVYSIQKNDNEKFKTYFQERDENENDVQNV